MKITGLMFSTYAADHDGQLPASTNGFGNALLLLIDTNRLSDVMLICGPGDDGRIFLEALKSNAVVPEEKCSRVYIQGLSVTNDPSICIFFDRNSSRGGDHFRWPWGRPLREVCMLDGAMRTVSDEAWPEFSRDQVERLMSVGFSRTNALRFYPAAK